MLTARWLCLGPVLSSRISKAETGGAGSDDLTSGKATGKRVGLFLFEASCFGLDLPGSIFANKSRVTKPAVFVKVALYSREVPMGKHIVDGPRTRDDSERLERYAKIDRSQSGKPSQHSEALRREARSRIPGEKLKRFAEIDRRTD